MLWSELIVEQRIAEATARGEFNDLPGAGKPLVLDEDPLVPAELRMAYRILKNAGFVPPEVELRKEIRALEQLLETLGEVEAATHALRKLQLLKMKLSGSRRMGTDLQPCSPYVGKVLRRLG